MKENMKILSTEHVTHDVIHLTLERPAELHFSPGQAADITINKPGWEKEMRPFTFTSLPDDKQVEFTIKTYPSHHGVTNQLLSLKKGDELTIHGVFGAIAYKGEGIFLAGGAGVTPFISILKNLERENQIGNNKLLFANKTSGDIILRDKFNKLLGKNFINILSDETIPGYEHGFISAELIKKHIEPQIKFFYLCGPPPMMDAILKHLTTLGIQEEQIVQEAF